MAIYDEVFNKTSIENMLFFSVKAVLIDPTLESLRIDNPKMFERWKYLSKEKYGHDFDVRHFASGGGLDETFTYGEKIYLNKAINHPEFCNIIAITYATVEEVDGKLKRNIVKIVDKNEINVIEQFFNYLHQISKDAILSSPSQYKILCGYNIIAHDIPLLLKRFIINNDEFTDKKIPYILKRSLNIKPWESGIVDVVNVWKFNGFEYPTLMLIADSLDLKKTVNLNTNAELSEEYWHNPIERLDYVSLQSATQTNLVIQLMNKLKDL